MKTRRVILVLILAALPLVALNGGGFSGEATAPSAKDYQAVLDKAVAYLKAQQGKDGGFSTQIAGPGISGIVVAGLARSGVNAKEPVLANGLAYLEKSVQKDGGIYAKALANYTTSVAVMAFKESNTNGKYDAIIKNAGDFLKSIQQDGDAKDVAYGGFGYDGKSRPDLSNTSMTIEALVEAGIPKDDPAFKKALAFVSRCQNLPGEFNDQAFAKKTSKDDEGGLTYTPFAGSDSKYITPDGGLRSLGSMTYGGLKSFLYAGVAKDDPRVKAAIDWIRHHYTLEDNPGMGKAGLYYYYHTFAKALDAYGENPFVDAAAKKHAWRTELFDVLKSKQLADGSWRNNGDRLFAEDNADLCTGFALLALSYCK